MTTDVGSPGTETLHVDAPSTRFVYRRRGPRGGVPLVLLHRFRGTIDWWDPEFLDRLTAERDVISFDNIGIGYTAGEAMKSVEGFAAGAIEFIEALGLSEVDLLGWSFGGVVAQAVTLTRPDLVRRVVLPAAGPGSTRHARHGRACRDHHGQGRPFRRRHPVPLDPETDTARASGVDHLRKIAATTPTDAPQVSTPPRWVSWRRSWPPSVHRGRRSSRACARSPSRCSTPTAYTTS